MGKRTPRPQEVILQETDYLRMLYLNERIRTESLRLQEEENNFQKLVGIHQETMKQITALRKEARTEFEEFIKHVKRKYNIPLSNYVWDQGKKRLVIRPDLAA